jgi:hypothetical protein
LQNISLRGRTNTVNLSCFCSKVFRGTAEQIQRFELRLFANSKIFHKYSHLSCFVRQFQIFSLLGWTNTVDLSCFCSQLQNFSLRSRTIPVNLSCFCSRNSEIFRGAAKQIQSIWVAFVRYCNTSRCAELSIWVAFPKCFGARPHSIEVDALSRLTKRLQKFEKVHHLNFVLLHSETFGICQQM